MRLTKKELKIVENFQYYDKYRKFPTDKKRINITISYESFNKLNVKNKSKEIEKLILDKFKYLKNRL